MSKNYTDRFRNKEETGPDWRHLVKWEPNFTGLFDEMPPSEVFENLAEPYFHVPEGKRKVLYVLDWVPGEDLKSTKLLSGITGDLLINLVKAARGLYLKNEKAHVGWRATAFSA